MRKFRRIPTLTNYHDWLRKAELDSELFKQTSSVYDITNCLLTLNAVPDWIANDTEAPDNLIKLAQAKIKIMKGIDFTFDFNRIDDIDHKLRFIRMYSNHSKHAVPIKPITKIEMCATYQAEHPIRFDKFAFDGMVVEAEQIAEGVISFWRQHIPSKA